jgi:hypothetical protein
MTFRPGPDAELLEALAFAFGLSRNEVLRQGLHALRERDPEHVDEVLRTLAHLKRGTAP